MILDRWKTNEVSPTSVQVHCLQSFQAAAAQGRRVEVEPDRLSFFFFFLIDFLSWGDDAESTGTQKQLEYLRQKTQGRELLRERTPEI